VITAIDSKLTAYHCLQARDIWDQPAVDFKIRSLNKRFGAVMAPIKNQKAGSAASSSSNAKMKQGNLFSFFAKKTTTITDKSLATSKQQAAPTKSLSPSDQTSSKYKDVPTTVVQNNDKSRPVLPQIGSRIEAYWPDDDEWYSATVSKQRGKQHFLEYDDGQTEWIDLSTERFRIVCSSSSAKNSTEAKPGTSTSSTSNKRRRIQIQDDDEDEDEMEFDDSKSDASDYIDDERSKSDQDLVTDDDADDEPHANSNSKRVKLSMANGAKTGGGGKKSEKSLLSMSKFKAGQIRVTEHKSTPNFSSATTSNPPNQITPSIAIKTPVPSQSPPIVQISKTQHSTSSPVAADRHKLPSYSQKQNNMSFAGKTVAPPMFVKGEMNLGGSHVHNHLKFLQNPRDLMGRSPDSPEYDRRTLKVDENEWTRVTGKPMTDAVKQWWDLKSQYFDTVLLFKTGRY
jgi:DNA mismatch repair protein MSH6